MKRKTMLKRIVAGLILVLTLVNTLTLAFNIQLAKGGAVTVPDDYPTIQAAINAANSGDNIFVRRGTYNENLVVNKSLSIVGEDKTDTVIDGRGLGIVVNLMANGVTISGLTVQNGGGIATQNTNGHTFENSIIQRCDIGLYLEHSLNNALYDNVFQSNRVGFYMYDCGYSTMRRNAFRNNLESNFYFQTWGYLEDPAYEQNIDTSNTVDGKPIYWWQHQSNKQVPTDAGLVFIGFSNNIIIKDLNLAQNSHGINLWNVYGSTIENVTASRNENGLIMSFCHDNLIVGNRFTGNSLHGLHMQDSYNNNFVANTFENNARAIWPYDFQGKTQNNKFYHNNFIDNTVQVWQDRFHYSNTWDDGYPSGGNYWSDYTGVDTNGDGIGDTSYIINSLNIDRYPLMRAWVQPPIPPPPNDLWIEDIEPVQTVVNPSIMVPGKPTVFNVTVVSTFSDDLSVYLLITCVVDSWYEGPYMINKNQKTTICTGGSFNVVGGQCYRPSGEFNVSIEVDAFHKIQESNETNNVLTKFIGPENGYYFKDLGQLKILYVPVGFWKDVMPWSARDPEIPSDNLSKGVYCSDSFIRAVFPVNPEHYKSEIGARQEMPAPPTIDPPRRRAWAIACVVAATQALKKYHQPDCGGYDRIIAVVPRHPGSSWFNDWCGIDARGMDPGCDTVMWCEEGYWATPAHELWHSYSKISDLFWHCSNSHTKGYWDQQHATQYIYSGILPDKPCLMVGGDLCTQTLPGNDREMDWYEWICPQCYANLTKLDRFKNNNDPDVLFVSGTVFNNGTANLQSFYHFSNGYADLESGHTGNFTLRFLDNNQQMLSDVGFNMTFELGFNVTGFGFAVPYPSNSSQIQLLHGDNVIATRNISVNSPTVNLTYPNNGETLTSGQNVTIQWQANDPDNDSLSFTALYTYDNGSSWIPIQTDVAQACLNWTAPNDHPTNQCRIKVVATDGVNTGEDISDVMFTILRHDIAASDISFSKNIIGEGCTLPLNFTVENCGNFTESFNVTIYLNETAVLSQPLALNGGDVATLDLVLSAAGISKGNYAVSVHAEPLLGEIDTLDNTAYGDSVLITLAGDIAQDYGIVDIFDITTVAVAFNSRPEDINWNIFADINNDNLVDIFDIVVVAIHFGETG